MSIRSRDFRLFNWNMRGGSIQKWSFVEDAAPDVAVLQECARPERLASVYPGLNDRWTMFWTGDLHDRGLLVAVRTGLAARLRHGPELPIKYALGLEIGEEPLRLLAVHSYNHRATKYGGSPTPLPDALAFHGAWLAGGPALVVGDFNNQPSFERYNSAPSRALNRWGNIAGRLKGIGLVSAYHELAGEAHGAESKPTFFQRISGPQPAEFHIDYVFTSPTLLTDARIEIGDFATWVRSGRSDHAPLTFESSCASRGAARAA